jgi:O-antigen/teichoic acid export membrane protein
MAGAWTLGFLVIGNACNGLMNIPYALQLAYGWPRLAFWINIGSIMFFIPGVWWAAIHYGAMGGAAAWAVLNFGYVIVTPNVMHHRLLRKEKGAWYATGVILPILACLGLVSLFKLIPLPEFSRIGMALVFVVFLGVMIVAMVFILPQVRCRAMAWWQTRWVSARF